MKAPLTFAVFLMSFVILLFLRSFSESTLLLCETGFEASEMIMHLANRLVGSLLAHPPRRVNMLDASRHHTPWSSKTFMALSSRYQLFCHGFLSFAASAIFIVVRFIVPVLKRLSYLLNLRTSICFSLG
jgi:hypothetical protein